MAQHSASISVLDSIALQTRYLGPPAGDGRVFRGALLASLLLHLSVLAIAWPVTPRELPKLVAPRSPRIRIVELPPPPMRPIQQLVAERPTVKPRRLIPVPAELIETREPPAPTPVPVFEPELAEGEEFLVLPPEPPARELYRVGGAVRPPVVLHRVEPSYPRVARAAGREGVVIIEAVIDRSGAVRDARVLRKAGFRMDEAAMDAVAQWRFEPGRLNGEPVDVIFTLTVSFRLSH